MLGSEYVDPMGECNVGTELRIEAIGTEDVILAVLRSDRLRSRRVFTTDSTRLAVQFVLADEEAWYVAGAVRGSYREQPGRPREFVKPITPWRSQFAEKRGYLL
jgi:hypothetical protein